MIDVADPLSSVLWLVFLFAAGMYPLGIILPCSTCCGGDGENCPTPIEFTRCLRIEQTTPQAPQTSFPAGTGLIPYETHGWSLPIRRITDIGVHRVATKYAITGKVTIGSANVMSNGESSTATYKLHLYSYANNGTHGKQIGEFRVSLRGVTRPMTWEPFYGATSQYAGLGMYEAPVVWEYDASSNQDSTSAAIEAEVVECNVLSGGQWLDGSAATASALRSMMSVAVIPRHYIYIGFRATFTAVSSLFNYVPATKQVELEYVIRHSRGGLNLYKRLRVLVYKYATGTITEVPQEGLAPLTLPAPATYQDSPGETMCSPVFEEDAASTEELPIWKVSVCSLMAGQTITMPTIEYGMSGQDFLQNGFSCVVTPGDHLGTDFFRNDYWHGTTLNVWYWPDSSNGDADWNFSLDEYVEASELKYIMRFRIPDGTNRVATNWNFDHDEVLNFINGEPLEIEMSGYYDNYYNIWYAPTPATLTRRFTISPPNRYCGANLCGYPATIGSTGTNVLGNAINETFWRGIGSDLLPNTVTFESSKFPLTQTTTDEKGSTTNPNYCASSDTTHTVTMRRSTAMSAYSAYSACSFYGEKTMCEGVGAYFPYQIYGATGSPTVLTPFADMRWFYCGDLLWAVENGPCRESVTIEGPIYGGGGALGGTYTLGGDDDALWTGETRCLRGAATGGVCPPLEVTVSVPSSGIYISLPGLSGLDGPFFRQCVKVGNTAGGDVVCSSAGDCFTPYIFGNSVCGSVNCLSETFIGNLPYTGINSPMPYGTGMLGNPWPDGIVRLVPSRYRTRWCDAWSTWTVSQWGGYGGGGCVAEGCLSTPFPDCTELSASPDGDSSVDTSVSPTATTVPAEGGDVEVSWCCPEKTKTFTIGANESRYERLVTIENPYNEPGRGATVYVTQDGKGETHCPFDVAWHQVGFREGEPSSAWGPLAPTLWYLLPSQDAHGPLILPPSCPRYGAVWHLENPPCEWSVARTVGEWFTVEKTGSGLIKVTATDDPPTPSTEGQFSITSGDTTMLVKVRM